MNIQLDHIHPVTMIPPKMSVFDYCGIVKERKAILSFKKYKKLRKKPYWGYHFWTEGYCIETVGSDLGMI